MILLIYAVWYVHGLFFRVNVVGRSLASEGHADCQFQWRDGCIGPILEHPRRSCHSSIDRRSNVFYFSDASPRAPLALFHTKERACLKAMDATA